MQGLQVGAHVSDLYGLKGYWVKFNQQMSMGVFSLPGHVKNEEGIYKSVCASFDPKKGVRAWKSARSDNTLICGAHCFVNKFVVQSVDLQHSCISKQNQRKKAYSTTIL